MIAVINGDRLFDASTLPSFTPCIKSLERAEGKRHDEAKDCFITLLSSTGHCNEEGGGSDLLQGTHSNGGGGLKAGDVLYHHNDEALLSAQWRLDVSESIELMSVSGTLTLLLEQTIEAYLKACRSR